MRYLPTCREEGLDSERIWQITTRFEPIVSIFRHPILDSHAKKLAPAQSLIWLTPAGNGAP